MMPVPVPVPGVPVPGSEEDYRRREAYEREREREYRERHSHYDDRDRSDRDRDRSDRTDRSDRSDVKAADPRKFWIGGVQALTEQQIKAYFESFGPVDSVENMKDVRRCVVSGVVCRGCVWRYVFGSSFAYFWRVCLVACVELTVLLAVLVCGLSVQRTTGEPRGFGFVTFATDSGAHKLRDEVHHARGRFVIESKPVSINTRLTDRQTDTQNERLADALFRCLFVVKMIDSGEASDVGHTTETIIINIIINFSIQIHYQHIRLTDCIFSLVFCALALIHSFCNISCFYVSTLCKQRRNTSTGEQSASLSHLPNERTGSNERLTANVGQRERSVVLLWSCTCFSDVLLAPRVFFYVFVVLLHTRFESHFIVVNENTKTQSSAENEFE